MFILVQATEYVTSLESPLQRAAATGAELLLGVILLLGTTWIATASGRCRIFTPKESPSEGGPLSEPKPSLIPEDKRRDRREELRRISTKPKLAAAAERREREHKAGKLTAR